MGSEHGSSPIQLISGCLALFLRSCTLQCNLRTSRFHAVHPPLPCEDCIEACGSRELNLELRKLEGWCARARPPYRTVPPTVGRSDSIRSESCSPARSLRRRPGRLSLAGWHGAGEARPAGCRTARGTRHEKRGKAARRPILPQCLEKASNGERGRSGPRLRAGSEPVDSGLKFQ